MRACIRCQEMYFECINKEKEETMKLFGLPSPLSLSLSKYE